MRDGAEDGGVTTARDNRRVKAAHDDERVTAARENARTEHTRSATERAAGIDGADVLERLLRGAWRDPDSGAFADPPPVSVAIEQSLAGREAPLVDSLRLGRRLAVVSDATTYEVMGRRVERALQTLGPLQPIVIERDPHADQAGVGRLRQATRDADALIAVGSGTINDLCKFAAAQDGKPYAVFATAPSMNGYTSTNAAITVDGHKKTLAAISARGVFMDLRVLCAAPQRMIRAGLGDSVCRSTAQADWLLSHLLLGTPYRRAPFDLLAPDEAALLDSADALVNGDVDAMRRLACTLVLSGLGMAMCGGSHPASQGEHLISHYIDMCAPPSRAGFFHGEQVAVATLTMAGLQQAMLERGPPTLRALSIDRAELSGRMGEELAQACWDEFRAKRFATDALPALNARISDHWDEWVAQLRSNMLPAARLEAALRRAGAPALCADIDLSSTFYAEAVSNARFTRNRYTFLDLVADTGQLDLIGH